MCNWHDASKELPRKGVKVLVWSTELDAAVFAEYYGGVFVSWPTSREIGDVTHWTFVVNPGKP